MQCRVIIFHTALSFIKTKGMKNTQTNIVVKFVLEGFHFWKDAPKEVAFLRDNHRHLFHFRLEKKVDHDDRDLEIILFGREVKEYLYKKYGQKNDDLSGSNIFWLEFGPMSCEMIARELLNEFQLEIAEVTEDFENGAIIYRTETTTIEER